MNADPRTFLRKALIPALLGAFLAGAAIAGVAVSFFSTSSGVGLDPGAGPTTSASAPAEPMVEASTEEDCSPDQVVEPGEYESIERSGSGSATWVIIPQLPEKTAPAPLYVLSVESFTGSTHELDLLRPVFEKLEGVVVLTALQSSDDEMVSLMAELARDFCVDAERVVTSSVPSLGVPTTPEPEQTVSADMKLAP